MYDKVEYKCRSGCHQVTMKLTGCGATGHSDRLLISVFIGNAVSYYQYKCEGTILHDLELYSEDVLFCKGPICSQKQLIWSIFSLYEELLVLSQVIVVTPVSYISWTKNRKKQHKYMYFLVTTPIFSTIKVKNGIHTQTTELNRKMSKPGHDNPKKMNYTDFQRERLSWVRLVRNTSTNIKKQKKPRNSNRYKQGFGDIPQNVRFVCEVWWIIVSWVDNLKRFSDPGGNWGPVTSMPDLLPHHIRTGPSARAAPPPARAPLPLVGARI